MSLIMPTPAAAAGLGDPPADPALGPVYERFLVCASAADSTDLALIIEAYDRVRVAHAHRRGVLGAAQAPGIALALLMPLPRRHRPVMTTTGLVCPTCSRPGAAVPGPCPAGEAIDALVPILARWLAVGRLPEPSPRHRTRSRPGTP